jgi:hypothetical protein
VITPADKGAPHHPSNSMIVASFGRRMWPELATIMKGHRNRTTIQP